MTKNNLLIKQSLRKNILKKSSLHLFLIILILLLLSQSIFASDNSNIIADTVSSNHHTFNISITASSEINEGELLKINFIASKTATFELYKNGIYQTDSDPYEWQTTLDDAGIYNFTLIANTNNDTARITRMIEVINKPLTFDIIEPNQTEYATNNIPLLIEPSANVDLCYYIIGTESNTLDKTLSENNSSNSEYQYSGNIIRDDGIYSLALKCKRGNEIEEKDINFIIDTTPPKIISRLPLQNTKIEDATISITTDEISACKYWSATKGENKSKSFSTNNNITHQISLDLSDGDYNYYVSCSDIYGNKGSPELFSFTLDKPNKAEISILSDDMDYNNYVNNNINFINDVGGYNNYYSNDNSDYDIDDNDYDDDNNYINSVLKAGTYKIIVDSKEPLINPKLIYKYQEGGSGEVILTKDKDTSWYGYLLIDKSQDEDIGSFTLKDDSSSKTDKIISLKDNLFRVDTIMPDKISNFKLITEDNRIKLSWYTDEAGVIIYRSDDPNNQIDYTNEYMRTNEKSFYDDTVEEGKTYYYAVSAVDNANNIGPLSEVKSITITPDVLASKKQNYKTNEINKRIDEAILDIDASYDMLQKQKSDVNIFISELNLLSNLINYKSRLKNLQKSLKTSLTTTNPIIINKKITDVQDELTEIYSKIPKRIVLDGDIKYEQPEDISVQNMLLTKLKTILGISDNNYANKLKNYMDSVKVSGRVMVATITFGDKHEESYTLINKELSYPQGALTLIEYLPNEVINSNNNPKILFTPEPDVIEQNKILKYILPEGSTSYKIKYLLKTKENLLSARSTRSILFPKDSTIEDSDSNLISGNVTKHVIFGGFNIYYLFGIIMIGGLLIYYFSMGDGGAESTKDSLAELIKSLAKQLNNQHTTTIGKGYRTYYPSRDPKTYFKRRIIPSNKFFNNCTINKPMSTTLTTSTTSKLSKISGIPRTSTIISRDKTNSITQRDGINYSFSQLPIDEVIIKAHNYIDNKKYAEARRLYDEILIQNKILTLSEEQKIFINQLYYKLLLYNKMVFASGAATTGEREDLDKAIEEIPIIASKIPETDSIFIKETKNAYKELKRVSNKLAIMQDSF